MLKKLKRNPTKGSVGWGYILVGAFPGPVPLTRCFFVSVCVAVVHSFVVT